MRPVTGSLQKKDNKYYAVIGYYIDGKRKQKWVPTGYDVKGNKKRAEKFLRDTIQQYEKKNNKPTTDKLFTDYINEWLEKTKISVSEVTYRGYLWMCKTHILPYFTEKGYKLSDVTKNDLQDYFNCKYANGRIDGRGGLSPKTLKEHKIILQLVFNLAIEDGLIEHNPCEFLKLPSIKQPEPSFYTKTQVEEMLKAFEGTNLYNLIYITVCFGLRRGEVLGIKWDSIDFERKQLTIKNTVVNYRGIIEKDTPKTKSSHRIYPLNDIFIKMFSDIKKEEAKNKKLFGKAYVKNDYVFKWDDGKPFRPDYITSKFSKVLKKNNLSHIRFHDLRHTCASLMVDNDYQLKDIQEWLGHADIQTTANIYSHIDTARKKRITEDISNLI